MTSWTATAPRLLAALTVWLPATVALGVDFEAFEFNDANFTELASTTNSANPGNSWSTDTNLLTDSFVLDGAFRVSKFSDVFAPSYLQIDNITSATSGSRYIVVEVAGWDFRGPDIVEGTEDTIDPEQIRFGFLDDDTGVDGAAITAQLQITRDVTTEGIQLEGSALGTGSTSLAAVAQLETVQSDPFTMVLELDKANETYEVFYRVGSGPSQSLGSGAVAPSRDGNSIRFVANNNFGTDLDEFFTIDRVALTDVNPLTDLVTLEVNRDTGAIKLINTTGETLPGLQAYSLSSAIGALDTGGWKPIADNYDNAAGPGDGSVDADDDWSVVTSSTSELSEAVDGGDGGALAIGQEIVLSGPGGGWIKNPREDLRAQLLFAGDVVRNATVEFVGNDGQRYAVGDLNFDGEITVDDWTAFIAGSEADLSSLSLAEAYQLGDLNYGGINSFTDLALFKQVFDAANGTGSFSRMIAGIPEPSGLTLAAAFGGCLLARRRRRSQTDTPTANASPRPRRRLPKALRKDTPMLTSTTTSSPVNRLTRLLALAAAVGVTGSACAEVQTFTDLSLWQAAVGATTFVEDFEGAAVDDFFGTAANSTRSPNGLLGLSANANFSDNAVIDIEPFVSTGAGINGSVVVNMRFLDGGAGANAQETVTVTLPPGVEAFAFEYNNYDAAGDGTFLSFEGTNGGLVPAFDSTVNGFFGVVDTDPGASITSFSFTGDPNVGTGFSAFNSFDDVRYTEFDALKLRVNSVTGQVELFNDSPTGFEFDSYRLTSTTGDLNFAGWNSLSDQLTDAIDGLDADTIVGNGIGETWDEAGGSDESILSESFLLGSSLFDTDRSVSLGAAFNPGGDPSSLTFEYRRASDGEVREALVEVVTTGGLPGDYNLDGVVNAADYTVWRDAAGQNVSLPNEDPGATTPGVVDEEDYTFWASQYGATLPESAMAVPEPGAALLTLLGLALSARCHGGRD